MQLRKLPVQGERVETGWLQFGDDWPGVFIRGDNALYLAEALKRSEPFSFMYDSALREVIKLLEGCHAKRFRGKEEIKIEHV